ncbi:MAG: FAD-linked oxidase [Chloroflexi bacterium HGW-Chloroflexi-10]|nr:MAG: FAD-linked oxidase [Chloroflexi bacterium HGW-Chloroflexi-10]
MILKERSEVNKITTNLSIAELRASLKGRVIVPGDADYDEARMVFSGTIDSRPAVIVRVANTDDISRVVSLAHETGLELAIRSGGHSGAGHGVCEGGIVLDLADMRALEIDVKGRTAWAETGLTAGEYTAAVGAHGLATGFGDTGSVGIGGITLGGGIGFLSRKYGMTIDSLLAAEVVTADGQLVYADANTNPDLFWAVRGGGGNFGVASRFKFQLVEVDMVVGGMLILPATADVIADFVAAAEAAPEELSTIANVMIAPPMPFLPPEAHGKLIVMALIVYAGDTEAGERALAPFRAIATPIADMLHPMHYPELFPPEQAGYHPKAAARMLFVNDIERSVAETILDHLKASKASMAVTQIRVLGGAISRVPADATAFAHRTSRIMMSVAAMYQDSAENAIHEAWVTNLASILQQNDSGTYVNFLGDEGEARVRAAYPGQTWERLTAIKTRYDPTNLFRLNQNIPPVGD